MSTNNPDIREKKKKNSTSTGTCTKVESESRLGIFSRRSASNNGVTGEFKISRTQNSAKFHPFFKFPPSAESPTEEVSTSAIIASQGTKRLQKPQRHENLRRDGGGSGKIQNDRNLEESKASKGGRLSNVSQLLPDDHSELGETENEEFLSIHDNGVERLLGHERNEHKSGCTNKKTPDNEADERCRTNINKRRSELQGGPDKNAREGTLISPLQRTLVGKECTTQLTEAVGRTTSGQQGVEKNTTDLRDAERRMEGQSPLAHNGRETPKNDILDSARYNDVTMTPSDGEEECAGGITKHGSDGAVGGTSMRGQIPLQSTELGTSGREDAERANESGVPIEGQKYGETNARGAVLSEDVKGEVTHNKSEGNSSLLAELQGITTKYKNKNVDDVPAALGGKIKDLCQAELKGNVQENDKCSK